MREFIFVVAIGLLAFGCGSSNKTGYDEIDAAELREDIQEKIAEKKQLELVRKQLDDTHLSDALKKYKPIIKKYSKRYGFDWRLIAAQIVQESGFKIKARSRVGAHGLMQIMPGTAREISRELDIEYIMKNPRENITAGIYHLKKQFRYFPEAEISDRTKLALASYNCGVGRVFDAQDIARYFRKSPNQWPVVSPYLTMLKHSDWELHLQVWPQGVPKHGYFYGSAETIAYVDNIWFLYKAYQKIL
ncbi:MAG: transglycosylase SLT domain-containing protein [Calditrichaceae bacterium]|jgi:membrane-bound lytic murein transglycosylase F